MIGMLITPIRVQLGPIANGLVIAETFMPSPKLQFPGLDDMMKRYQAKAGELKTDALGYAFVPMGYAAGQVLAKAVTETKSLDHDKLAAYIHANKFDTVVGDDRVRQGRRMDRSRANVHDAVPERRAEQPRPVPRRLQAADPVAAGIQERRHDLPLRRRAEEMSDHAIQEKPPPQGGGFVLGNVPLRSQRTNRFANPESNLAGKFCVNAIASIAAQS